LLRALEVIRSGGRSIRTYQTGKKAVRDFRIIKIAIDLPRIELYQRINNRVDQMVAAGLEKEARTLYPQKHLKALQTVGYTEWFDHFDGAFDAASAVERIKQNTRRYAKRQLTWLRREKDMHWIPDNRLESLLQVLEKEKQA
jgi:tRNA dimethylallyltransferase